MLARIAYEDWRKQIIRDRSVMIILALAFIKILFVPDGSRKTFIVGMLLISIPMLFLSMIRPGTFGGGDIKLMAAAGGYLGMDKILLTMEAAVLLAALYCIYLIVVRKKEKDSKFPLGPFLCAGMFFSMCCIK